MSTLVTRLCFNVFWLKGTSTLCRKSWLQMGLGTVPAEPWLSCCNRKQRSSPRLLESCHKMQGSIWRSLHCPIKMGHLEHQKELMQWIDTPKISMMLNLWYWEEINIWSSLDSATAPTPYSEKFEVTVSLRWRWGFAWSGLILDMISGSQSEGMGKCNGELGNKRPIRNKAKERWLIEIAIRKWDRRRMYRMPCRWRESFVSWLVLFPYKLWIVLRVSSLLLPGCPCILLRLWRKPWGKTEMPGCVLWGGRRQGKPPYA